MPWILTYTRLTKCPDLLKSGHSEMAKVLDQAARLTDEFVRAMPKALRKSYGQFFTGKETAEFMAGLFSISSDQSEVSLLDPGAGSGLLSVALLERLEKESSVDHIHLTCYETDVHILPLLRNNLELACASLSVKITYTIKTENYITSQASTYNDLLSSHHGMARYDMVICNPPYMKVSKNAPEARAMPDVCYGAPNLYFLFAAMGLSNLRDDGEMVYIIPRSWTSGAYFKAFRRSLLTHGVIEHIHLFGSRSKVFDGDSVLQETMIIKLRKTQNKGKHVTVTYTKTNKDFANVCSYKVLYNHIVRGPDYYIYLITNKKEDDVVGKLSKLKHTLKDFGLVMKTGLTVDFREKDLLRQKAGTDTVPLFFPCHIRHGRVVFPLGCDNEYISNRKKALTQPNVNYLFVKRFTAKEEVRRLQCAVYLARKYPEHERISTQNKINFIAGLKGLSECVVYGLFVLFNSSLYDAYYRILNGSTQVNSTEINNLPVPDISTIEAMGRKLISRKDMSEEVCNEIIKDYL